MPAWIGRVLSQPRRDGAAALVLQREDLQEELQALENKILAKMQEERRLSAREASAGIGVALRPGGAGGVTEEVSPGDTATSHGLGTPQRAHKGLPRFSPVPRSGAESLGAKYFGRMTPEGKNEAVCFGKIRWQLPAEGGSERVRLPKDARCPAGTSDLVGPPLGLLPVPLHGHQEGRARVLPVPSPRAFQRGVFLATSTEALQPSACPPVFAALIHRPPAPWEGLWAPWRGQDPPIALISPLCSFPPCSKCTSSWTRR